MNSMDKYIMEYVKRFHENFPMFMVRGSSDEAIVSMIKKCLKENKPYEPEYKSGVDY